MEQLDMNFLLNRQSLEETFRNAIDHFEKNKKRSISETWYIFIWTTWLW